MSQFDTDVDDLIGRLEKIGGQAVKIVNDEMGRLMKEVQTEARARAPEDEGALDAAIKLESANRRETWTVYIDESMPDDTGNYTVGDYASWLHEGILGVTYNLGPKSLAKLAVNPMVGPKFLEGAFTSIVNSSAISNLQRMLDDEIERRANARRSR